MTDFLLQFMLICKEKPATLPLLMQLALNLVHSSLHLMRGGSSRHRTSSGAFLCTASVNRPWLFVWPWAKGRILSIPWGTSGLVPDPKIPGAAKRKGPSNHDWAVVGENEMFGLKMKSVVVLYGIDNRLTYWKKHSVNDSFPKIPLEHSEEFSDFCPTQMREAKFGNASDIGSLPCPAWVIEALRWCRLWADVSLHNFVVKCWQKCRQLASEPGLSYM